MYIVLSNFFLSSEGLPPGPDFTSSHVSLDALDRRVY
jgi:hypothetical protein